MLLAGHHPVDQEAQRGPGVATAPDDGVRPQDGAGVGERIFFVRGSEAAFPFHPVKVPTDASIVGIVDHTDMVD